MVSELIYSLSNLLILFNDGILASSLTQATLQNTGQGKVQLFLTILEYCEVFIEYSAKQLWGDSGRWFFIFLVQVTK